MGAEWPRSACNPPPGPIDYEALQKLVEEKYPNGIVCYPDPPAKVVKTTLTLIFENGHGAVVLAADEKSTERGDPNKRRRTGRRSYRDSERSKQLIRTSERRLW